jgi:hypothetical protein
MRSIKRLTILLGFWGSSLHGQTSKSAAPEPAPVKVANSVESLADTVSAAAKKWEDLEKKVEQKQRETQDPK